MLGPLGNAYASILQSHAPDYKFKNEGARMGGLLPGGLWFYVCPGLADPMSFFPDARVMVKLLPEGGVSECHSGFHPECEL